MEIRSVSALINEIYWGLPKRPVFIYDKIMIKITESASNKILALKQEDGKDDTAFLRVEIKKGGCSGLSYKMDFDSEMHAGDKAFEAFGQRVVVDQQSILYVIGMELDYSGGLNGKGFVFNNPNATKNCGCGSSFNV